MPGWKNAAEADSVKLVEGEGELVLVCKKVAKLQ